MNSSDIIKSGQSYDDREIWESLFKIQLSRNTKKADDYSALFLLSEEMLYYGDIRTESIALYNKYGLDKDGKNREGELDKDVELAMQFYSSLGNTIQSFAAKLGVPAEQLKQALELAKMKCPAVIAKVQGTICANSKSNIMNHKNKENYTRCTIKAVKT